MKKVAAVLFLCFVLSSCKSSIDNRKDDSEVEAMVSGGIFEEGVVGSLEDFGGVNVEFSLDKETALEIGDIVLRKAFGDERLRNSTFVVSDLIAENLFIVTRLPMNYVPGEDYNVALDKSDGRILKVWMGE